jgi:hypothetical protein
VLKAFTTARIASVRLFPPRLARVINGAISPHSAFAKSLS